ncbi:MAG: hypothetical protein ACXVBH_14070 [Flavisolibacter sp.]
MKWWFILSILFIVSCGNHSSQAFSADQQGLFKLSRDFRNDYKDTSDSRDRERLIVEYELKLQNYLKHACSSRLENMNVKMKKIVEDPKGTIYAEFADKDNEYVFQKIYDSAAEMKADTSYRIVKSLQEDSDVTVGFMFAGNVKVNEPAARTSSSFQIEVIPTAIVETK